MKIIILFSALAFAACSNSTTPNPSKTFTGASMSIGTGSVNSYVTVDGSGKFSAIGITVTDGALASLGNMDTSFELEIPTGVTTEFKSIMVDYAVHDQSPYNHPHLDPHFFLEDMSARMTIVDGKDTMMPTMMHMPAGYMSGGMSEMMMGVHWMDSTASEFHNQPFQASFVYGTSMGSLVFMEAMCDKASLDGNKSFSGAVKQPTMVMSGMGITFPSNYSISHDVNAKSTKIELNGF